MNRQEYRNARRYAYKVTGTQEDDSVHDAYLVWFNKTGKDLFDEANATIVTVVKNLHLRSVQANSFMWRGNVFRKKYERLDDPQCNFTIATKVNPESILLSKERFERLNTCLSEFDRSVLQQMINGYLLKEIEGLQGRSNPVITAAVKRIKKQVVDHYIKADTMLTNPINANPIKIAKEVSLAVWENKIDQDDYELDDENEFYRVYIHKESKDGLLIKLPPARMNPYIK